MHRVLELVAWSAIAMGTLAASAENVTFTVRTQVESSSGSGEFRRATQDVSWPMESTAVIVCDVWDYHHCLNAVRRLEEFTPRLNEFVQQARRSGATIIHAPSDCMEAYSDHPARKRALETPRPEKHPVGIEHWCSRIPREEQAVYPIDQSDGGEDDDPKEHATWAAKLKTLGRNPAMPWKAQSSVIEIDAERDYITDLGDEVWNILEAREIKHVILTGVHANMCVLGRPFGLRQMTRNGKDVVFLRDVSDSMYNPARWPYVNHFTGHDLVVSHIERYVCPTITSDQLLGGEAFRSKYDDREERDVMEMTASKPPEWTLVDVPTAEDAAPDADVVWYRCAVRVPKAWTKPEIVCLQLPLPHHCEAWINGVPFRKATRGAPMVTMLNIDSSALIPDEANFLCVRVDARAHGKQPRANYFATAPWFNGQPHGVLAGRWQMRVGDDPAWKNLPLPAKFGAGTDILFEPAN